MPRMSWQEELDEITQGLMTLPEAADYLGVTVEAVEALMERERLYPLTIKGYRFLAWGQVDSYRMRKQGELMGTNSFNNPVENPFKGVNPILHTLFQIRDSVFEHKSFQIPYVTNVSALLNRQLKGTNYFSRTDGSIRVPDRTVYPDALVKGLEPELDLPSTGANSPDLVVADLPRLGVDVLIGYRDTEKDKLIPVTAIELLSPTNLDRLSRIEEFNLKQRQLLDRGINVVVLHFLQIFPPVHEDIPRYSDAPDSAPYHLTITRPQDIEQGYYQTQVFRFGVDTPIPTIAIPLLGNDKVVFNFDVPYQIAFENERFNQEIDYDTISPDILRKFRDTDHTHLEQRLAEIRLAYHDLAHGEE